MWNSHFACARWSQSILWSTPSLESMHVLGKIFRVHAKYSGVIGVHGPILTCTKIDTRTTTTKMTQITHLISIYYLNLTKEWLKPWEKEGKIRNKVGLIQHLQPNGPGSEKTSACTGRALQTGPCIAKIKFSARRTYTRRGGGAGDDKGVDAHGSDGGSGDAGASAGMHVSKVCVCAHTTLFSYEVANTVFHTSRGLKF